MRQFWSAIAQKEKRAQVWMVFLSVTFLSCFFGWMCPQNDIFNTLIYAMFADLGATLGSKIVKK